MTDALLGGAFGSRITSNIREDKGYTYSPGSFIWTRKKASMWVETADVTSNVTGASLTEIFKEIDRLRTEAPPQAELDGIKNNLAGVFTVQNSSRYGLINQLEFVDLHGLGDEYVNNYVKNDPRGHARAGHGRRPRSTSIRRRCRSRSSGRRRTSRSSSARSRRFGRRLRARSSKSFNHRGHRGHRGTDS